jgi:hypothetical protein
VYAYTVLIFFRMEPVLGSFEGDDVGRERERQIRV